MSQRPVRSILPAVAGVFLAALPLGGARAAPPADVVVKTIDRDSIQGTLVSLSAREGLLLRTEQGEQRRIPTVHLVRLTASCAPAGKRLAETTVTLVGGDYLHGRVVGAADEGETLVLDTGDLGRVALPLDAVVRVVTAPPESPLRKRAGEWLDRLGELSEDRVLMANGDVLGGFVTAVDVDRVSLDTATGETSLPLRLVAAMALNAPQPAPLSQPHLVIRLRHSGRLTATDLEWSGDAVEARLRCGPQVQLEADRVSGVEVLGGKWEHLTMHQPISSEQVGMLSLTWEPRLDRNVLGGPLTVGGETFERGLGVHSRSHLTYELRGGYREFVTSYGLDDHSGPYADVSVLILVDHQPRHAQSNVRPGTLTGPIRLDVARANHLELIVDFGENGDIQDRFDWIDPALIR
ncbi:MAG: NPCBM/NEW2 domain-containing protein [Planctomycetes bacterium]|nr:NPCBM/NEW2 domain-containing protein [Planctomycetota bacterium]